MLEWDLGIIYQKLEMFIYTYIQMLTVTTSPETYMEIFISVATIV